MFSRRDTLKISLALSAMGLSAAPAFAWKTGEPEEKISCDILVVGSGIAGTVAALQAVEDGAKVLMIDKASENQRGGNSRVCLGSFLMPENNSPEARKAFIEDVKKKSLGGGRTDLYEVLADNILDSVKWAESNGAAFEPWLQQAPWNVGVRIASPGQYRGMPKLLKTLFDKYIEKGGKVLFKTKAKQLLVNKHGAVDGAICQTDKGLLQINAKAVILGTGGYSANREMLEAIRAERTSSSVGTNSSQVMEFVWLRKSVPEQWEWLALSLCIFPLSLMVLRVEVHLRELYLTV